MGRTLCLGAAALALTLAAAGCGGETAAPQPGPTATATADPEPDLSTGLDGPVLRYPEPPVTLEGEAAIIAGVLELDGDCLYVMDEGASSRFPVVWPYGTRWDPEALAVVTPLGDALAIGTAVEGGGGYWNADSVERLAGPEAAELARRCADGEYREIARVNNQPDGIGPAVDD